MPCKPYIVRVLNPNGPKILFRTPFRPNTDIIPKIATIVGKINGAPRIVIKIDLPQNDYRRDFDLPGIELVKLKR